MKAVLMEIKNSGILGYIPQKTEKYKDRIFIFLNENEIINNNFVSELQNIGDIFGVSILIRYSKQYNSIVLVIE